MARPMLTTQNRGERKRPYQDASSSAGPSNPEPKIERIARSRLITMKRMDGAASDPIIGTGKIGVLNNSDTPNGDLFIDKIVGEDGKNKILRTSHDGRNSGESLRLRLFEEIVTTDCFRTVLGHLDELKTGINLSWFVDKDILMFNVHLKKNAILQNMESLEKTQAATRHDVSFFNQLVSDLHPHLEQQIKNHSWIQHDCSSPKEDNFDDLYQTLRSARVTPPSYNLRLDSLACTLRGYQKDAVDFLIHREVEPYVGLMHESIEITHGVFYLPSFGRFVKNVSKPFMNVVGGVLAEEMGLGKTVELLGLILSHQSEEDTKILRKTRKTANVNRNDEFLDDCLDDSLIVKDLLGEIVSKVSAFTEGKTALKTMKVAKKLKQQQRQDDAFTLVSSVACPGDVCCAECGEAWSTKKVHWLPELEQQNLAFKCPTCTAEGPKVSVSATLIVVPKSIAQQWYEEIRKHVKEDVKIDVSSDTIYLGIAAQGYKNPHYFSQFHIVLTTYDVVEREFLHDPNHKDTYWQRQPRARSTKRPFYWGKHVVSPLPSIHWWRVCLDEWQMVKNGQAGEIFFKLQASARWCITGTPLVKSFYDFQPMLRFLGVRTFWKNIIYDLYGQDNNLLHLVGLMAQLFWRNSKKDVEKQLGIPPKKEIATYVQLSPIEMEYYKLKVDETRNSLAATLLLTRFADDERQMSQIAPGEFHKLMNALNSVRWSLVTGEGYLKQEEVKGGSKQLTGHTPQDVFNIVADKTRSLLEERSRNVIRKFNELADRKMYSRNYTEVLDCSIKVLSTVIEYESKVKAVGIFDYALATTSDVKHQIHAITNLLKVAHRFPSRISDGDIVAYKLQLKNLEEGFNNIHSSIELIAPAVDNLKIAMEHHKQNDDNFKKVFQTFQPVVDEFAVEDIVNEMVEEIDSFVEIDSVTDLAIVRHTAQTRPNLEKCKSKRVLCEELERTYQERQDLLDYFLNHFLPYTKVEFLAGRVFKQILDCKHNDVLELYRERTDMVELCYTNDCPLCQVNRSILDVEEKLSIVAMEEHIGTTTTRTQRCLEIRREVPLRNDPFYMALNSIIDCSDHTTRDGSLEKLEDYMGSHRNCILLVNNIVAFIQVVVTKSREMRIRAPVFNAHAAKRVERTLRCESELRKSQLELRAVLTTISFVQTLMTRDNETLECPICYMEFGEHWQMLPCLHNMCSECYRQFIKQTSADIKCVICRSPFKTEEVKEVTRSKPEIIPDEPTTSKASNVPPEQYTIKGLNLTFKMAAIIRNVVSVLNDDPTNKIIIFSAIDPALKMLSHIMNSVDLQHIHFNSRNCDLEGLAVFKENFDFKVLLLPLSFGANGLNLVEANHIFFLEPIPNASVFQQARGRVFRMGQNRSTTIHHLITKDTIEETIHAISTDANETGLTVGAFKKILDFS